MHYEVTELRQKTIVGVCARTRNSDPQMGAVIGGLWKKLFEGGIFKLIADKLDDRSIGLYSDYASDADGDYAVTAGCEVGSAENLPEGTVVKIIPAGRYARFAVQGNAVADIGKTWQEIWKMELNRTFTGDFEEYPGNSAGTVHIYVAIK